LQKLVEQAEGLSGITAGQGCASENSVLRHDLSRSTWLADNVQGSIAACHADANSANAEDDSGILKEYVYALKCAFAEVLGVSLIEQSLEMVVSSSWQ
jgi:hypothetical protein